MKRGTKDPCLALRLDEERGGSMVETALMAPIFVVLVMWAAFFYDFVQLRIKVLEAARFAAWEFTAYPLSDYDTGSHGARFNDAVPRVRTDVQRLYASLDSSDQAPTAHPRLATRYSFEGVDFENKPVRMLAGDVPGIDPDSDLGMVTGYVFDAVGDALDYVLNRMGYNDRGLVTAQTSARIEHALMPRTFLPEFYGTDLYPTPSYTVTARAAVVADGWTLHDGRTVVQMADSPFQKQVQRAHTLGITDSIPGLSTFFDVVDKVGDYVEDFFNLPNPLNARLAAKRYTQPPGGNTLHLDTDEYQKEFDTLPVREQCQYGGCRPEDSDYGRTLKMRGDYYMGCPEPERMPGQCRWNSL
ncbi:MAG: pilus assembly protein [Deltaproteobacteria bacterium]|nr:MAG: pilus assembly protein [Deltaproteobacteria bacterium]